MSANLKSLYSQRILYILKMSIDTLQPNQFLSAKPKLLSKSFTLEFKIVPHYQYS